MPKNSIFSLKGKVAVVTGGAGHLGRAISESLAEAGAVVAVASRDAGKCRKAAMELSKKYGTRCEGFALDVSSSGKIKSGMKKIHDAAGRIDILVNNAYYGAPGDISRMSEDEWEKGIDGTVSATFRCTQAAIPYMEKKGGVIINVASMYGMVSPDPSIYGSSGMNNPPNYGAGKAGVIQLTRYSACHLAGKNIRVNSISPGAFPGEKARNDKKFMAALKKKIPLGRVGNPEELKGAVLFLASGASSYVTGTNIVVDGGWTVW